MKTLACLLPCRQESYSSDPYACIPTDRTCPVAGRLYLHSIQRLISRQRTAISTDEP